MLGNLLNVPRNVLFVPRAPPAPYMQSMWHWLTRIHVSRYGNNDNSLLNNLLKCPLEMQSTNVLTRSHAISRQMHGRWFTQFVNMKIPIAIGLGLPLMFSGLVAAEKQYGIL
ncbi:hypothetical protein E4T51_01056 [Aureobasidium sp. EXF-12344]|nr:hypothetical protein E4T51_01056 [Aureobasidium sp. EXF-12344]